MTSPSTPSFPFPWPIQPYHPESTTWPYQSTDFSRMDPSPDTTFYSNPRFVTHIDDHAISTLRAYYASVLPSSGKLLEICSSWVSHLPAELEAAALGPTTSTTTTAGPGLHITGYGLSTPELAANPVLSRRITKDLNTSPTLDASDRDGSYDAAVCVVSIDYLIEPRKVLESVREAMRPGASVHLVLSNRCFPTKAVRRWLEVGEEERVMMVGDYLWFSGWRGVEVVRLVDIGAGTDPLWVVRGTKGEEGETGKL